MMINKEDRDKVLLLFKKMSESKPGLLQKAEVSFKDQIDGRVYLVIKNMSEFDNPTKKVILNFLNQFKYKRPGI